MQDSGWSSAFLLLQKRNKRTRSGFMKNFNKEWLRLYAVTDRAWLGDETLYEQVAKA